jgi:ABC-type dipeptide/oligopeptide/nickel transport system permease component
MEPGDYPNALLTGFQLAIGAMVFAVAMSVVIGRWITANESWVGMLLRGGMLMGLGVLVLSRFHTIWYWILIPLAVVPLVDEWGGVSVSGWLNQARHLRLSRALMAAAGQPGNPVLRMNVGAALLETGQTKAGLAAIQEAMALAPEDSRELLNAMAAEAEQEFVRHCRACGHPNPSWAWACRRCLRVVKGGAAARAVLWLSRPALLRLRRAPRQT